jgi:arsenical pump membrane protein
VLGAVSVALLAVVLVAAVSPAAEPAPPAGHPRGLREAVIAGPATIAALVVLAIGAVSGSHAREEVDRIGPVVGFLAAVLVLSDLCAREGLFDAAGAAMSRRTRGSGSRLLVGVVAAASLTTAVLSLDTTVVLLTPVVLVTARRAGLSPRPHLYSCAHLSNSASLLLPVSNLTNLLALAVLPISFVRFAALMVLPWLVAIGVELGVMRWWFRRDLHRVEPHRSVSAAVVAWPRFALVVVVATLAGFVIASVAGVEPVWVAGAGAAVLAVKRLSRRESSVANIVAAAAPSFCLFVLALAVVVRAVSDHGLADILSAVLPVGGGLPALLGIAAVAAVTANVLNNLPATLALLPVVAPGGAGTVLAVLVGVNVGPNLTYVGSLATLLWRRVVGGVEGVPRLGEFTVLGLLTVPIILVLSTTALWLSLRAIGAS